MGKIVLLDDATINKIAAGEVIERPASVVKEIMENSIDAGADKITVEIKNGGISYIRVTDNGKGIMQDDMEIAFERHATSKLRNADELSKVMSMGFRGEALASIAAIARVSLLSKTADSENGYEVIIEGGKILSKSEAGCSNGTSITIENLFYNTPVRYKFLKKDFTESGYIEDVVTRIALVHPEIAIKLINTGKTVIQTSGNGDLKSVVYGIYGKEVAENLINVDYSFEDMTIKGVIGKPEISRANRSNQLFFVNKRYVKDKTLSSAAEQAFKDYISTGKHGFLILNIEMDPQKVDVNVHPAKLEVRFQEENMIFKAVYHAIKDSIIGEQSKNDVVSQIDKQIAINNDINKFIVSNSSTLNNSGNDISNNERDEEDKIGETIKEEVNEKTFEAVMAKLPKMQNIVNKVDNKPQENEEKKKDDFKIENYKVTEKENEQETREKTVDNENKSYELKEPEVNYNDKYTNPEIMEMYNKTFGTVISKKEENENKDDMQDTFRTVESGENISVFQDQPKFATKPLYKYVGLAFGKYIMIEIKDDFYIINQTAAQERMIYERLKENYYMDSSKNSQLMLLPDIINLNRKQMSIYQDNREIFRKAGFTIDEFGEDTIKLSGVPEVLIDLETKEVFLAVLDEINKVSRISKGEIEEKFLSTIAAKAAGETPVITQREFIIEFLDRFLVVPDSFKPVQSGTVAIKMTKADIEKKFSRRQ